MDVSLAADMRSSSITPLDSAAVFRPRLARPTTAQFKGSEPSGKPESGHDDVDVAGQLSRSDVYVPATR
jgi:hypothetical protein